MSKLKNAIILLIGFCIIAYFGCAMMFQEIETYEVDVIEKSPLFPYQEYDYLTTEDTIYNINKESSVVPAFYRTDFASIPKALWFIDAPYKSSFVYPSIWHDYNYSCPEKRTRKEIDDMFFWLLRNEGNSLYSSLKMYIAVRIFGRSHFTENSVCEEIVVQKEKEYYSKENSNHG